MRSSNQNWFKPSSALKESFYRRDALSVAKDLLGKGLFVGRTNKPLVCEIVEVEAYLGNSDPASHAYRGVTKRNWPMFEVGGTSYVYLSYGLNYCFNVVTGTEGSGEAVLIRAAMPLEGLSLMAKRRALKDASKHTHLLSGPGKLTQALGITLRDNGLSLYGRDFCIIDLGRKPGEAEIGQSPRIGISQGVEAHWRFFIKNSPWLSRKTLVV